MERKIIVGQRYMSLAEPELGLGIILGVEQKIIEVSYPAKDEVRRYGFKTAPLKRIKFEIDDEVANNEGLRFIVNKILETETGLMVYLGSSEEQMIVECDLEDSVSFHRPEEKLLNAQVDSLSLFNLRQKTLELKSWYDSFPLKGFLGGRVSLIEHQLYLANKVVNLPLPRVLLADEVGLGKTIEAGLILNHLLLSNRVERVLVCVPNSLTFQWFIEMFRKYNLTFSVINEQVSLEKNTNPFDENNLVICSLHLLENSLIARDLVDSSKWDLLVIDEAHKLDWKNKSEKNFYPFIENLTKTINGLILLTATPTMLGLEGHFERLKLIDHNKFNSFEEFEKMNEQSINLASIATKLRDQIELNDSEIEKLKEINIDYTFDNALEQLLDQHGTGRIYYRNSRKSMEKIYNFFPKRIFKEYKIEGNSSEYINRSQSLEGNLDFYEKKLDWLVSFLENRESEKVLLICRSKKTIQKLEEDILKISTKIKMSSFHSDLSLMARDRQIAYFADPEGANLLLCTEIGSEGRNLEFCHHLVLFDIPRNPDLLEQRIGRLDRIGQKSDISIHLPYVKNSWEEILLLWYRDGLNAFEYSPHGGMKIYDLFEEELNESLENVESFFANQELIQRTKMKYKEVKNNIENGQDVLIECNSFNSEESSKIKAKIQEHDEGQELKNYLDKVFSEFGVDCEDIDDDTQYIKPSENMFIPSFPGLNQDGFSFTYNRKKALEREDLSFMSWDHPLVQGVIDLILGQEYGNACVAARKKEGKSKVFVEAYYSLAAVAPGHLEVERFLPIKSVRVLLDGDGNDFSEKWPKEVLDTKIKDSDPASLIRASKIPKSRIREVLKNAQTLASTQIEKERNKSLEIVNDYFTKEIKRLKSLKKMYDSVSEKEITTLQNKKHSIIEIINKTKPKFDSLKIIM